MVCAAARDGNRVVDVPSAPIAIAAVVREAELLVADVTLAPSPLEDITPPT